MKPPPWTTNIYIHDEIEEIEGGAFYEVDAKEIHIYVEDTSPFFMAVDDVLFSKDGRRLIYIAASKRGNYDVPDGVEDIEEDAVGNLTGLESITIPPSVKHIPRFSEEGGLGDLEVVRGIKGSYAEQWAKENWYDFEEVDYIPEPLKLNE